MSPGPFHPAGPDLLTRSVASTRRLQVTLGTLCVLVLAWAWWPLATPTLKSPDAAPVAESNTQVATAPLDLHAFDAGLWIVPKTTPVPVVAVTSAPAPPPPLKLQLLGIVTDTSGTTPVLRAALYDPDTDRIVMVVDGDKIAGRTVQRVDDAGVAFALGNGTQSLLLRPDAGGKP